LTDIQLSEVIFEMLLSRRPVSYNSIRSPGYKTWKDYINEQVRLTWNNPVLNGKDYYFQIIYICHEIL